MTDPDSDGFEPLRDRHGSVWAYFNRQTRTLRRTKKQPAPGCPTCEQVADLSIERLLDGDPNPITTFSRPRRSIE